MKRDKLFRVLLTLAVVALLTVGLGFALPSIRVNVQELGVGYQQLVSPVSSGSIWFSVDLSEGQLVFSNELPSGTHIYVSLYNSSGDVIAFNYSIVLSSALSAGVVYNYTLSNPTNSQRSDVSQAIVTVVTPDYQTILVGGGIAVTSQQFGVGIANTTVFCTPITIKENSGHNLYNYSVLVVLNDSNNANSETWEVDWNIINSTNLYFTDNSTPPHPLYFWVQLMDTQNKIAYIWVKIPELLANSKKVICLHYGEWPNPYLSYDNPDKVFILFDNFDGSSINTSKWNVHGTPSVSNGILYLSSGQWIWSKKSIPGDSFQILVQSTRLRASPFFMWFIDNRSLAWAEVFNGSYWSGYDELDVFNVSSGEWGASYLGSGNPVLGTDNLINITVQPYNSTTSLVTISEDSGSISQYLVQKETDEPIGLGQWYYYNWRGRARSRTSSYDWILVRQYVNPEPSVSVGLWYYSLKFYPQP
ncbi:DUF2341 domain-containing protein [Thermococcus sp.]|uniref:DUF2341 domain-containing protein n=1 Tax=Thermococcus sp. TaxID=35749 RepID=UPI00261174B4|nr:DUF2341 domain-containing protein [Thermococcus sp.]